MTYNLAYLFSLARVNPEALSAIIVAKGPGSFNGLRVGMSIAKGIAFSLNIPILGISTLEVEAYPFAHTMLPLRPIHEVGHGEIATALYQQRGHEWHRREEEHLISLEVLCRHIKQKTLFCGQFSPTTAGNIEQVLGNKAIIAPGLPQTGFLAMLGGQKLERGEKDDLATLQPLYLRPPHITEPKRKKVMQILSAQHNITS